MSKVPIDDQSRITKYVHIGILNVSCLPAPSCALLKMEVASDTFHSTHSQAMTTGRSFHDDSFAEPAIPSPCSLCEHLRTGAYMARQDDRLAQWFRACVSQLGRCSRAPDKKKCVHTRSQVRTLHRSYLCWVREMVLVFVTLSHINQGLNSTARGGFEKEAMTW